MRFLRLLFIKPITLLLKLGFTAILLLTLIGSLLLGINLYMVASSSFHIEEPSASLEPRPIALVLGASVNTDGSPSPVLAERLNQAIALYKDGKVQTLLLSGDGQEEYYNEVQAMSRYCQQNGVPASSLVLDPAGLSTSESIAQTAALYPQTPLFIITQRYHLYRSLFIAKHYHLNAVGIPCDQTRWGNGDRHIQREFLARIKDFIQFTFPNLPAPLADTLEKIIQKTKALGY